MTITDSKYTSLIYQFVRDTKVVLSCPSSLLITLNRSREKNMIHGLNDMIDGAVDTGNNQAKEIVEFLIEIMII